MNIVFFGTPEFAKQFLAALHADQDISVSAVVCQPDKPVGRKKVLTAPPTKTFALEHNIPVLQPEKKKDILPMLQSLPQFMGGSRGAIDAFVVVAYGKIIPQKVLDVPKHGSINVHPSLLPKYRGPSPIQAAILNKDVETGISIMLIDDEMDHGPILAQESMALDGTETPETLRERVVLKGAPLLVSTLKAYVDGNVTPQEQKHNQATFCKMLKKEDGRIDWNSPAEDIEAQIRAFTPWPGSYSMLDGKMLKIHVARVPASPNPSRSGGVTPSPRSPQSWGDKGGQALRPGQIRVIDSQIFVGTGSSPLELFQIQVEGKPRVFVQNFLNGNPEIDGKQFN